MKVYALYLYRRTGAETCDLIDSAKDFGDVSFAYRRGVIELCDFAASQLVMSLEPKLYTAAQEKQYRFYCFRKEQLAAIAVVTEDYPGPAAWNIVREIMHGFEVMGSPPGKVQIPAIQTGIRKWQDPTEVDKIAKIERNLEETRQVMVENLQKAIARGQSLDDLAQKSEEISAQSKMFSRKAKDLNRCCVLV